MKPINESVQHVLEEMGVNSQQSIPDTIQVDGKERPTRNSKGKLIHPTMEGIENFWGWFGDSKVVDGQGKPLVVYHGTMQTFDSFFSSTDYEAFEGSHFGSEESANARLRNIEKEVGIEGNEAPQVKPVYLRMVNPIPEVQKEVDGGWTHLLDQIKTGGHDGFFYTNAWEDVGSVSYAVMEPSQIKSATGNRGTFNPSSSKVNEGHQ